MPAPGGPARPRRRAGGRLAHGIDSSLSLAAETPCDGHFVRRGTLSTRSKEGPTGCSAELDNDLRGISRAKLQLADHPGGADVTRHEPKDGQPFGGVLDDQPRYRTPDPLLGHRFR